MNRKTAIEYVAFVVDDSGNGRKLGEDPSARIYEESEEREHASVLVGWQCGFEPLFVAVHSYLDVEIYDQDAEEMAADYLEERGWFGVRGRRDCDYIIRL